MTVYKIPDDPGEAHPHLWDSQQNRWDAEPGAGYWTTGDRRLTWSSLLEMYGPLTDEQERCPAQIFSMTLELDCQGVLNHALPHWPDPSLWKMGDRS